MVLATLLLTAACQSPAQTPKEAPASALPVGIERLPLGGPEVAVSLRAGEILAIGALSDRADVELIVRPATGQAVSARSRGVDHQAANVRIAARADGVYRVGVRGLLASDRGDAVVIRRRVLGGSVCAQLDLLGVRDPWALEGAEEPGADDSRRTRSLVDVAPWAHECTVNRLGAMDVGPSCALSGVSREEAEPTYAAVEAEFRACHAGWMLSDEGDATTREVVAERGAALHFVRIRDNGDRGWQVSVGAMPGI